jgi:plastocyanin
MASEMRRGMVSIVVTIGLALAVVPALAARDDETIMAVDFAFEPSEVRITVGDTVTFTIDENSGNFHNFSFTDGAAYPEDPSGPDDPDWDNQSRTFTTPARTSSSATPTRTWSAR